MKTIKLFEAFAGIGAQHESLKQLLKEFPGSFELKAVGLSEIDANAYLCYQAAHGNIKNFGDITRIDWDDVPDFNLFTYSSPCFVAGTLVQTDRGMIPIEEVRAGDKVLTHTNSYKKVLKVGSINNAPTIQLQGMCCNKIICTPNHPFYARSKFHKCSKRMFSAPEWIEAKDLKKNHYLGLAINQKAELPNWSGISKFRWKLNVDELSKLFENIDFWYVMGRYIGDGWCKHGYQRDNTTCNSGRGVIICCSDRNRESLEGSLRRLGWSYSISEERTVTKITICSNELYSFVGRYGYMAYGKHVDIETLNLPKELLKGFVEGVIESDGCYTQGVYKITTVSRELAYSLGQCVAKVFECPIRIYMFPRPKTTVIEGRTVNQRDTWTLVWHPDKRKQDHAFFENGYVWFPLKDIPHRSENADVYNMEVETDNSYTANGAIVHNCQDWSQCGKQAGGEEGSGTRSSLLWECRRAILAKKPKYAIFENVPAVLSNKFKDTFLKWVAELDTCGYNNFFQVVNAKHQGTAQNRPRLFMVSILRTEDDPNPQYAFPHAKILDKGVIDYLDSIGDVREDHYINEAGMTPENMAMLLEQPEVKVQVLEAYHQKRIKQNDSSTL